MFNENLKSLRKEKGFSQEELAIRLHVVRQTISKWEKGLSVPDADLIIRIAEILETSVSQLLGAKNIDEADEDHVAEQLSRINEQLAIRNHRAKLIWRIIFGTVAVAIVINIIFTVIGMVPFNNFQDNKHTEVRMQNEIAIPEE